MEGCVFNASGPRSISHYDLELIALSGSAAVVSKTTTIEPVRGDLSPRTLKDISTDIHGNKIGSLCSEGLPNMGCDYYVSNDIKCHGKPYFVSIAGTSAEETCALIRKVLHAHASGIPISGIEVNLSCPKWPGQPIIAYDFEKMQDVLRSVADVLNGNDEEGKFQETPSEGSQGRKKPALGVKLAPYFEKHVMKKVVEVLLSCGVSFCVVTNSLPNGLFVDTDHECRSVRGTSGYWGGGLGGTYLKPFSLANIFSIHCLLKELDAVEKLDIVGVGGISTGEDAFQAILCGASAVQLGTCHLIEGPSCFGRVASELLSLMKEKGYSSISEFRGKLKPWEEYNPKLFKKLIPWEEHAHDLKLFKTRLDERNLSKTVITQTHNGPGETAPSDVFDKAVRVDRMGPVLSVACLTSIFLYLIYYIAALEDKLSAAYKLSPWEKAWELLKARLALQ